MSIRTFIQRHWRFTGLGLIGLTTWFLTTATIGDAYAVAVGPDFIVKVGVKLFWLAVWLTVSRWIVRERFPTVDAFTRRGIKERSEFERVWNSPLGSHDPRLMISILVHIGVPIAVGLVLALVF